MGLVSSLVTVGGTVFSSNWGGSVGGLGNSSIGGLGSDSGVSWGSERVSEGWGRVDGGTTNATSVLRVLWGTSVSQLWRSKAQGWGGIALGDGSWGISNLSLGISDLGVLWSSSVLNSWSSRVLNTLSGVLNTLSGISGWSILGNWGSGNSGGSSNGSDWSSRSGVGDRLHQRKKMLEFILKLGCGAWLRI